MPREPIVGVLGAGDMGLPMAKNMSENGYDVVVFDPDREAQVSAEQIGAHIADSAAGVGERADIVFVVLPTDDIVRAACTAEDGLFRGMDDGIVLINSSVHPSLPEELQDSTPENVDLVDAPMCRGAVAAENGELLFLVGGAEADIEECRAVLETCGEIAPLGDVGAGQVGKTANNLLLWNSILTNYEVLRLAESLGVDAMRLRKILPKSSGDNYIIRPGNWESVTMNWADEDLDTALDLASEADSSIPVSGLVSQLIKDLQVDDLRDYYFEECKD